MRNCGAWVLFGLALVGCGGPTALREDHYDHASDYSAGFHYDPQTAQGGSAIEALRKRLDSRYINLGKTRFGSEGGYEFLYAPRATWESFGWEGRYHTSVIFFRKVAEPDWSNAAVYRGIVALPDSNVLEYARTHGHLLPLKYPQGGSKKL